MPVGASPVINRTRRCKWICRNSIPEHTTDLASRAALRWSGLMPVPAIGTDVVIRINGIGLSKVVGYGACNGYLGVMTVPYDPPRWWVEQNGIPSERNPSLAFGAELSELTGSEP